MPSQEFQQLVGLRNNFDGKGGVLKDCDHNHLKIEHDAMPKTDDQTKEIPESKIESGKQIVKVSNIYDALTNNEVNEESDIPSYGQELITPFIDNAVQTDSWLWKKYENPSESSHFLNSTDNDCGNILPDQPYVKIDVENGNTFVPPNIFTSHIDTYMCGSTIDTQFFKQRRSNKQIETKVDENKADSTDDDGDIDESDYEDNYDGYDYDEHEESLPSSRQPYRKFKLNRAVDHMWFSPFYEKVSTFFEDFQSKSLSPPTNTSGSNIDIDATLEYITWVQTTFETIFSKIIRKTAILFVNDIIKNVLVKQPSILPTMSRDFRIKICRVCEDYSAIELEDLKRIINDIYVPVYSTFTNVQKELLTGAFGFLAMCTAYHYNSGYRQTMSVEQSVQCVKYIGTFSAGIFSIIISENDKPSDDQVHFIRILGKHLLLTSKLIVIPNYNSRCFVEMYSRFQFLEVEYRKSDHKARWRFDFINLNLFFEKHSIFFKTFKEKDSLLGYDKGYLIRLINEWYQIFPFHLINITSYENKSNNTDFQISLLIYLTFLAIGYELEAIVPGIRSLLRASFIGLGRQKYDSISNIMNVYRLFTRKEFKVYAIYTIRVLVFFKSKFEYSKLLLSQLSIPEFTGYPEMPIEEKYERLKKWKFSSIFHETSRTSFDLFCGTYIEKHNYSSVKQHSEIPPPERKIYFQHVDEMIYDFESTNSGLLSGDYNPRTQPIDIQGDALSFFDDGSLAPIIAHTSDEEVNSNTIRNCWQIEHYIKLGNALGV